MSEKEKKTRLDKRQYLEEAKKAVALLDQEIEKGSLADLGNRGMLLADVIGELRGFLAHMEKTGTLLERAVWLVNMFDQADTGGTIMNKPNGAELRKAVEKLRTALNQNGKRTFLDSQQIKEALKERAALSRQASRRKTRGHSEFLKIQAEVAKRNKDRSPTVTL